MIALPDYQTDFSRFFRRKGSLPIPNNISLVVDGVMIECNGPILAQHSEILFEQFTNHNAYNEVYLDEFTGMIEGVLDCIEFLYGADVAVTLDNLQALMKFSIFYEIRSLYELCVFWVQDNVSLEKFERFFMISYFVNDLGKHYCHALDACKDIILRKEPTEFIQVLKTVGFKHDQKDLMMFFLDPMLLKFTLPLITDWLDTNEKVDLILNKIEADPARYIFTDTPIGLDFTSKLAATATSKETVIKVNRYVTDLMKRKEKTTDKVIKAKDVELFLWRKSWNGLYGQDLINHLNSFKLPVHIIIEICMSIPDESINQLWPTVEPDIVGRIYYDVIYNLHTIGTGPLNRNQILHNCSTPSIVQNFSEMNPQSSLWQLAQPQAALQPSQLGRYGKIYIPRIDNNGSMRKSKKSFLGNQFGGNQFGANQFGANPNFVRAPLPPRQRKTEQSTEPQGYYMAIKQGQYVQLLNKEPMTLLFNCQVRGCRLTSQHAVTLQLSDTKPCYDLSVTASTNHALHSHVHEGSVVHWYLCSAPIHAGNGIPEIFLSLVTMSLDELLRCFGCNGNRQLNVGCILR